MLANCPKHIVNKPRFGLNRRGTLIHVLLIIAYCKRKNLANLAWKHDIYQEKHKGDDCVDSTLGNHHKKGRFKLLPIILLLEKILLK
jgi:hypothetical protein